MKIIPKIIPLVSKYDPVINKSNSSLFIISGSRWNTTSVTGLLFTDQSKYPRCIIKSLSNPQHDIFLENENKYLTYIHSTYPGIFLNSIPQSLGIVKEGNRIYSVQTPVQGNSMRQELFKNFPAPSEKLVDCHFNLAKNWLIHFYHNTRSTGNTKTKNWIIAECKKYMGIYSQVFNVSPEFKNIIYEKINYLQNRLPDEIFYPLQHGDFWHGNILVHNNQAGVIDWEMTSSELFPFTDIFTFLITYSFNMTKSDNCRENTRGFELCFFENNWYNDLCRNFIKEFSVKWDLEFSCVMAYLPIFLLWATLRRHFFIPGYLDSQWVPLLDYYMKNFKNCLDDKINLD